MANQGQSRYNIDDKVFVEKHDKDLDTTLIVAALFSAVSTAFVLYIQPQLQEDSGDDSASLLRILVYKTDNTTFGGSAPTLPLWNGPSRTIIAVQLLLYLSLMIQVASVVFSILTKQMLHLFAFRTIWRSKDEREDPDYSYPGRLRGMITFLVFVLPLALELSLFLLSVAVTTYLWKIEVLLAGIVLAASLCYIPVYVTFLYLGLLTVGFISAPSVQRPAGGWRSLLPGRWGPRHAAAIL